MNFSFKYRHIFDRRQIFELMEILARGSPLAAPCFDSEILEPFVSTEMRAKIERVIAKLKSVCNAVLYDTRGRGLIRSL